MIILTLRTDKPESEIGIYDDQQQLAYITWEAHRQLAETIHQKIRETLDAQKLSLDEVRAIAVYKGPGSFTGLRIGVSVANAIADSYNIPIVARGGEDWITQSTQLLQQGANEVPVQPEYGSPPHITKPKR